MFLFDERIGRRGRAGGARVRRGESLAEKVCGGRTGVVVRGEGKGKGKGKGRKEEVVFLD